MAVESNGRAVEPGQKGMNGHAKAPRSKPVCRTKKRFSLFSVLSRILTWFSILTILLRCPSTVDLLTDSSPKICKPYFQARSVIAPNLEPYYHTYAAPFVDASRPYYEILDKRVLSPATALGKQYGAPRVAQAQAFSQAQWDKNIQPRVQSYQAVVRGKYDQTLGPHLDTVVAAAGPYYEIAKTNAQQTYYEHILPTYNVLRPYALKGYGLASDFAVYTVLPYSKWAWTTGVVFVDRTVWPQIRILYGENVEPQLVRIGERLGRYRDGRKLKAVVEDINSSSSASVASQTLSSVASSISSVHASPTTEATSTATIVESSEAPEATPESEKEIREKAQNIVGHDLKEWQEKFAKAADEGSVDLEERITEITDRMVRSQAEEVGKAHIIQLEETVTSSLKKLKSAIVSIVRESKDIEESEDALTTAVRKAGIAIKEKARAVRSWKQNYDRETSELIGLSAQDTFQILDHIRDLGLQEIGMRWAWTDGITHKDWAKYHHLKTKFDEWRVDVENVVTGHPGLDKARAASQEIENQAMAVAEDAAKELARLKETGRWKIQAADSSDDFSTKFMPAPADVVIQKVAEKASELSEVVASSSSQAQDSLESVISLASQSASSILAQASSSIIGKEPGVLEQATEKIKSATSGTAGSVSSFSDSVISCVSSGGSEASKGISQASSSLSSATSSTASSLSKSAFDTSSSVSSAASSASKVWGGAVAQHVEAREIMFEDIVDDLDDASYSEKIQSMASEAGDRYADMTNAVSEALLKPTRTENSPMTKLAADRYSSALSAASVALYGTEKGTGESISSVVASKYDEAVAAARAIIYGTPMPITESIVAQATEAYNAAISRASDHYSEARSLVSAQIFGEPKPVHEELYSSVEAAFSDSKNAASSRLQSALAAASTVVYETPTPSYQSILSSISSVAQAKLSDGLNRASAHYQDGKDYVAAINTGTPAKQKLLVQMQEQYYAGIGMAHARYSEFLDSASSAVMPTKTPAYESLYSRASAKIAGTPTHMFQAALNTASAHYSEAVGVASSKFDQLLASISSLGSENAEHVPTVTLVSIASAQYSSAISQASKSFASIKSVISDKLELGSSSVSSVVYGTETPWTESVASAASENWEALITKASEQVYGAPTPYFVTRRLLSEVKEYAAQATDGAISQYAAVQSLIGELVSGKEPDFTESVYGRLSSAYYTGAGQAASSASSYASEAYASATAKANEVIYGPEKGAIESAQSRLTAVVESARVKLAEIASAAGEGASDTIRQASESVEDFASSVSSAISSATSTTSYENNDNLDETRYSVKDTKGNKRREGQLG